MYIAPPPLMHLLTTMQHRRLLGRQRCPQQVEIAPCRPQPPPCPSKALLHSSDSTQSSDRCIAGPGQRTSVAAASASPPPRESSPLKEPLRWRMASALDAALPTNPCDSVPMSSLRGRTTYPCHNRHQQSLHSPEKRLGSNTTEADWQDAEGPVQGEARHGKKEALVLEAGGPFCGGRDI